MSFRAADCAGVGRRAVIGGEQPRLRGVVELVVDREVAEVEQPMSHAGVLPVDEHHGAADAQQVRRQQVVVTCHRLGERQRRRDPGSDVARRRVLGRQHAAPPGHDRGVVFEQLRDPEPRWQHRP